VKALTSPVFLLILFSGKNDLKFADDGNHNPDFLIHKTTLNQQVKDKFRGILNRHVPPAAVDYCYELWERTPFHFKLTRSRNSKLGDYRFDHRSGDHSITVNFNLNCYSFLITYIHEYAHLLTIAQYGRKVPPHGKEWQSAFRQTMLPLLNNRIFPLPLLNILQRHMQKPKASSQSDPALVQALRVFDHNDMPTITLEHIADGELFTFQGRTYKKLESRRTRVLCHHVSTGRRYLINKIAPVEKMD